MQLENSFSVPVGIDDAWKVLLDIEQVVPCMPGAALDTVHGDAFTGSVKIKLGPIGLTYKGKASFIEKDEAAHRAVIDAQGKDARGNGTAGAKVTAVLTEQDSNNTRVDVTTDLNITGKPAQFGRGVMVDVGNKLIGQFADCLAGKLAAGDPGAESAGDPATDDLVGVGAAAPAAVDSGAADTGAADTGAADTGAADTGAADTGVDTAPLNTAPLDTGALDTVSLGTGANGSVSPGSASNGAASVVAGSVGAASVGAAAQGAAGGAGGEPSAPADLPAGAAGAAQTAAQAAQAVSAASKPPAVLRSIPPQEVAPIDLLGSAGPAILKRVLPLVAVAAALLVAYLLGRRK